MGHGRLYLVTDLVGFYEKYGANALLHREQGK